jgi:hypothetical protein
VRRQVIAWIAEERLSEKAKAGVKELLGDASLSDAEVVSSADENVGMWNWFAI